MLSKYVHLTCFRLYRTVFNYYIILQRILAADNEAIQTASQEIQLLVRFHLFEATLFFSTVII